VLLQVLRGLQWGEFADSLTIKVGILNSARRDEGGEEEGEDMTEARDLTTQAALLAIDAYLLAGPEGVPTWVANLLALDLSAAVDEETDEASGLQMKQLLAVADWAVLEALLCPQPTQEEEDARIRPAIYAGMPSGQSFGLLRPLLAAPSRVAPGLDNRLLQVIVPYCVLHLPRCFLSFGVCEIDIGRPALQVTMSLKDAALALGVGHASAVAASAARGVLLVSIGPTTPPATPASAATPCAESNAYWHLAEEHHSFVMQRVMVPLLAQAAPSSASSAIDVAPDIPSVIALEVSHALRVRRKKLQMLT
jgi:hypothetical protein